MNSMGEFLFERLSDPEYYEENRVAAHSDHVAYRNWDEADVWLDPLGRKSSFRLFLDGSWKFHYARNYEQTIHGFEKPEYDCRGWDDIRVPAHIQMEGYDSPQYANTQYPWDGREDVWTDEMPTKFNPVASYVKYFTLPESFLGERVFISFQGAESGMALWLNGAYVGYSEDSFTPSEFELTPYLKDGENKLAVQVFKWTIGSWCEDQDFFRFSGIFRSVYLYMIPKTHLCDIKIRPQVAENLSCGTLELDLRSCGSGSVRIQLVERGRLDLAESRYETPEGTEVFALEEKMEGTLHVSREVADVKLWSAEEPYLYELRMEVYDAAGALQEVVASKIGFRRFEMKDGLMLLNGKRIVFKGVNRHEFSSLTGRVVSMEETLTDVVTMKWNNINSIRTCHYPDNIGLYELCDIYGLYMIAENNMESHGSWDAAAMRKIADSRTIVPGDNPKWEARMLDRVNSCYQRDKNHPAILIWSCGNEAFGGKVIYEMSQLYRKMDPNRLVHYEGVCHDRRYNDTSDMESQMYPSVEAIQEFLEKDRSKPFICCEYTHAMGNSCGGMHKYTDLTDTEPSYQGGFIWDYIDQSIYKKDRYGKEFQAYGGDFNDRPCDYNFSGNGIAYGGERDASPKMQDVKFNYQNISAKVEKDQVTIVNKNLFINTDTFDCFVVLAKDGKEVKEVLMETHVAPLSEETVSLPIPVQTLPGEYAVTVSFRLKEDTVWAKRGHEVAFGQGVYKVEAPAKAVKPARFEVIRSGHDFGVRGENFDVLFSYLNGGLASYRYGGVEMIQMIPRPNFWRAPVDNDNGSLMQMRCGQWKLASMYLSHKYPTGGHYPGMHIPEIEVLDDSAKITFTYAMPTTPATECKLSYQVYGDGSIRTTLTYDPVEGLGDMPEFGVMFKFDADYDNVTWYGMGPEETYVDRCEGAKLGIYKNKVEDNMAKYMVPQECGNKVGVRWASVTDRKGRGMLFTGDAMEFSALPYTPHEMENAMHPFELPQVHYTVVRVSKQQMGIAGDDSWGAKPLPEYLIKTDEKMEFTFTFKGI